MAGLTFNGTSGEALYAPVDLSNTPYTQVFMGRFTQDDVPMAMICSEDSSRLTFEAFERLGTPGIWNQSNVWNRYRHTTNDDFVWTPNLVGVAADGLFCAWIDKVNGGGVPLNFAVYLWNGSAWAHKTGSPTTTNFQLANGNPPGIGGHTVIGSFGGVGDWLKGDCHLAAIFTRQVSAVQRDAVMSSKTTLAMLAQTPAWLVDANDGLTNDLSGNNLNRTSMTGTIAAASVGSAWSFGTTGGGSSKDVLSGSSDTLSGPNDTLGGSSDVFSGSSDTF